MNCQMKLEKEERWVDTCTHIHTLALKRGERNCVFFRGKCLLLWSILNSSSLLLVQSIAHFPICVKRSLQYTNARVQNLSLSSPLKCQPSYTNWREYPHRRSTKMLTSLQLDWEIQTDTWWGYICTEVTVMWCTVVKYREDLSSDCR